MLSLKTDVIIPTERKKQKNVGKSDIVGTLKATA
jgi:hypothetical protein